MSSVLNRDLAAGTGSARDDVTDVDVKDLPTDTRRPIWLGFLVLVLGFGGFLVWAAYAPLDEGVVSQGTVVVEMHRRPVQHVSGGVVKRVLVREGQQVKAGDPLIELDEAATKATFESIRQTYLAQRAAEGRLLAELGDKPAIEFHPDLMAGASDPAVRQHIDTQKQLFMSRRLTLQSDLDATRASIVGLEAQIAGQASMLESRESQAKLQSQQIANLSALAAEGYAPRNQILQLEQSQAELRATTADLKANRLRAQQGIAELRERMNQRRQEYQRDSSAQLADVRREVQAGQDRLKAISGEFGRMVIKSPVDGQVVGLTVSGTGGVVTPGQKLLEVIPHGESLLIDARISPQFIDRVNVGTATDVRFTSFAHTPQLVVNGKVIALAGDVQTEPTPAGPMSFYLARIQITPEGVTKLSNKVVQPGMQAEVVIKTGERSLLTYLLHPLTKRIAASMKEE
jgi:protease secretion system membrane fusion protein